MPSQISDDFCTATREALAPLADAENAVRMGAYMKEHFAYLGIPSPKRREATRTLIRSQKEVSSAQLLETANALWEMPEREYQYVAIDLLASHQRRLTSEHIADLILLAQKKSWWDSVDGTASIVGGVLKRLWIADKSVQRLMDDAVIHPNLWVRRIAMIHQLGWRADTDVERLFSYARVLAPEKDFFIRKAIGWALREYAKQDREAVQRFLRDTREQLSPLTIREGSRHMKQFAVTR